MGKTTYVYWMGTKIHAGSGMGFVELGSLQEVEVAIEVHVTPNMVLAWSKPAPLALSME